MGSTRSIRARTKFRQPFGDLDDSQADTILRPLVVTIAWVLDRPSDPLEHFVAQVHDDLRTATINSLEWVPPLHTGECLAWLPMSHSWLLGHGKVRIGGNHETYAS